MFDAVTHPKKLAFLHAYSLTGSVKFSAEAAKVKRGSHYDWLAADEAYAAAFKRAEAMAADALVAGIVGSANAWSGALGSIGTAAQQANAQFNLNQSGYQNSGTLGASFNNMATGAANQLMKPLSLGSIGIGS